MELAQAEALVDRLEAEGALGGGERQAALLRYLIREELTGAGARIKAFAIATDVFGRGDDFDPQTNSIVRVEVGRLRRALDLHFATAGRDEPVAIVIDKGGYRPTFVVRSPPEPAAPAPPIAPVASHRPRWAALALGCVVVAAVAGATLATLWPRAPGGPTESTASARRPPPRAPPPPNSVEVAAFRNDSGRADLDHFGRALSAEVTARLGRIKTLQVAAPSLGEAAQDAAMARGFPLPPRARHLLSGDLLVVGGQARLVTALTDTHERALVWMNAYPAPDALTPDALETLSAAIIFDLRGRLFASARRIVEARGVEAASPLELFLLSTWFPGYAQASLAWERDRVALARRALAAQPDFAHSVLADKLAYLANVDPPSDTEAAHAEARSHAERAAQLAPDDPDALFNVALHHWHGGDLEAAGRTLARVLELQSGHPLARFMARAVPYTCAAPPPDVLEALTRFDAELGPDNPVRWTTLGWLARLHLNGGDNRRALLFGRRANAVFAAPDTVYVVAAATAGLGDVAGARRALSEQKPFWPNLDVEHYLTAAMSRRCRRAGEEPAVSAYRVLRDALAAGHGP